MLEQYSSSFRHRLLHARLDVALLTSLPLSHEHVAGATLDVFIFRSP
jgi:hypothetical protein